MGNAHSDRLPRLDELSLEQKVGQMLFARGVRVFADETWDLLRQGLLGGVQINSSDPSDLPPSLQDCSPIPLFTTADMESGFRGPGFGGTAMPVQMALGAIGSEETAYEWARIAAIEARVFGVNFVFGPVVDMANAPDSAYTNIRALHADADEVARLAIAVVKGYQDHGMQVAAKHYPGAGRAPADTHIERAILRCSLDEFRNEELAIYRRLIEQAELTGVMSGHVAVAAVDGENMATVSPKLTGLLADMGFKGLLISDSLTMKGIKTTMKSPDLFGRTLAAGHDMIIGDYTLPPDEQLRFMMDAVKSGMVSEEQVDRSVRKILAAKRKMLNVPVETRVDRERHLAAAAAMSRRAVTVVGDGALLKGLLEARPLFIVAREPAAPAAVGAEVALGASRTRFEDHVQARFPGCEVCVISEHPGPSEIEATLHKALDCRDVVFAAFASIHSYKGTALFSRRLLALIGGLKERIRVFVTIGNPYAARELPTLPCLLFAYDGAQAEQAAVEALASDFMPQGHLPVPLE